MQVRSSTSPSPPRHATRAHVENLQHVWHYVLALLRTVAFTQPTFNTYTALKRRPFFSFFRDYPAAGSRTHEQGTMSSPSVWPTFLRLPPPTPSLQCRVALTPRCSLLRADRRTYGVLLCPDWDCVVSKLGVQGDYAKAADWYTRVLSDVGLIWIVPAFFSCRVICSRRDQCPRRVLIGACNQYSI